MIFLSDLVTRGPPRAAGLEPHKPEPTRPAGPLPALINKGVSRPATKSVNPEISCPPTRSAMSAYPDLHASADTERELGWKSAYLRGGRRSAAGVTFSRAAPLRVVC